MFIKSALLLKVLISFLIQKNKVAKEMIDS